MDPTLRQGPVAYRRFVRGLWASHVVRFTKDRQETSWYCGTGCGKLNISIAVNGLGAVSACAELQGRCDADDVLGSCAATSASGGKLLETDAESGSNGVDWTGEALLAAAVASETVSGLPVGTERFCGGCGQFIANATACRKHCFASSSW